MNSEAYLDEVAAAILDGTDIDWESAESSSDADHLTISQLKRLSRVASAYGSPTPLWGHLRILEVLGRGAYGQVHRAWDTRLDREVALKLLPAPPNAEDRTTSIIEEGRLLARVRHPNVATIYGADRIGDQIGLWMELVEGRTLEQLLEGGRRFSVAEVTDIGIQIANALDAVHGAGLLHRDVKAQNVILGKDGRCVLTDFGTGLELSERTVSSAGTPLYLAPEVLCGSHSPNVQSDVYAVGVLLYRMLTNTYPVAARTLNDLRAAHAAGQIPDLRAIRPDTPVRLKRVIERAVDPDPSRRHTSARTLAADLERCRSRNTTWILAAVATIVALGLTVWGTAGDGARDALTTTLGGPAIAVLPIENLTKDTDSDWLADGLTDEIINSLAAVQGLQVRSRTSSFAFKGKPYRLDDVANQLHVNLVLASSMTVAAGRVRVNTQLVKMAGDEVLWGDTFDRELKDIPAIQHDIVRAIADRLRLTLGRGQRRYDMNLVAYEAYQRARQLNDRRGVDSAEAVRLFEQAIKADGEYAPAYAGLANAYAFMSMTPYQSQGLQGADALDRMRAAARKALDLDQELAEAHAAMGAVYAREHRWAAADQSFRRAIDLNPILTEFYTNYSFFVLQPLGEHARAEALIKNALWSDPKRLDLKRELAQIELSTGRYQEAIDHLLEVRNEDPAFPYIGNFLLRALTLAGRLDEAQVLLTEAEETGRGRPAPHYVAWTLVKLGRRAEAEQLAREGEGLPFREALIYAALGDLDRAFEAMNRAADTEPQRIPLTLSWPEMRALRNDPRMMALRQRFNLPIP